jgi:hypothetical protein
MNGMEMGCEWDVNKAIYIYAYYLSSGERRENVGAVFNEEGFGATKSFFPSTFTC